ncbi:MAG: transcription antitermination factor NusB [Spirochaetota bacterium]
MGSRRNARILAMQGLYQYDLCSRSLNEVLSFNWCEKKYDEETLRFARTLLEGTINNLKLIDESIRKQLEHWDLSRLSFVDRAILRFSTFSLFFQDDVPDTVIINEAVDIAKIYGSDDSYRFVNGVLDGIRKEKEKRTRGGA